MRGKGLLFYILKRLGLMVLTLFLIVTFCFFLIHLLPGVNSAGVGQDDEIYAIRQAALGYDKTLFVQYLYFWKNLFYPYIKDANGVVHQISPWGYSTVIEKGSTPAKILLDSLPPTILINLYSIIISIPLGIGLGLLMASIKNKSVSNGLSVLTVMFIALPGFVYAFLFQYLFGYVWGVLPTSMQLFSDKDLSSVNWFNPQVQQAMVLPVLALTLPTIAGFARVTHAEVSEVLSSPFMLSARSKGMSKIGATFTHALRNAMVPIFPMILGQFIGILSGSIIIESIFGVPGVGGYYIKSINSGGTPDYAVFLFLSIFYAAIGLIGSLITDIGYTLVDPRMRVGAKKGGN